MNVRCLFQREHLPDFLCLLHDKYARYIQCSQIHAASLSCRRIVGVAHVVDFESIADPGKRAYCEHRALEFAKILMKGRRGFQNINQVVSAIHEIPV